jgi:uncharacterized protein (DUF1684 family)
VSTDQTAAAALQRLDWRRRVTDLYAGVRAERHPRAAHGGWAAARDQLYASHPASPADPELFAGFAVPDHDPSWRAAVRLEETEPARIVLPSSADRVVPFDRVGVLRTPWGRLDAWQCASYGSGLWIPVRDAGSGGLSFGGGRYLYDSANGIDLGGTLDGRLVVDLNFLYAPPCAHDPRELCPLPPTGNVLDVVVPVGELLPG